MNPDAFETTIRKLKEADYGRQRKTILAEGHASASQNPIGFDKKKSKLNTVDRLAALWLPSAPRVIILGSRLSNDEAMDLGLATTGVPSDSSGNLLYTGADRFNIIPHFGNVYLG